MWGVVCQVAPSLVAPGNSPVVGKLGVGAGTHMQDDKPCEGKEDTTVLLEDSFFHALVFAGCSQDAGERQCRAVNQ